MKVIRRVQRLFPHFNRIALEVYFDVISDYTNHRTDIFPAAANTCIYRSSPGQPFDRYRFERTDFKHAVERVTEKLFSHSSQLQIKVRGVCIIFATFVV
jgi:hypothetical protein